MKSLYWIFPCYNEEECLPFSYEEITDKFNSLLNNNKISKDSKLVFVDDGSKDKTWEVISSFAKENKNVVGIKFSRNKGHQYAVEAGLRYASSKKADFTITMDVDLQDDINVIDEMIDKYYEGFEVVYGVRNDRKSDSFLKRATANGYYSFMKKAGVEMISNAADFRLIGSKALEALLSYNEANLFLRGLVPQVGYPSAKVEFKRLKRKQGKTHYSFSKMYNLAIDGITAFSDKPLRFITLLGEFIILLAIIATITLVILNVTNVLAFSIVYYLFPFIALNVGILLIALGIVAIYIGRINIESKHRPHYFIEEILDSDE